MAKLSPNQGIVDKFRSWLVDWRMMAEGKKTCH